MISPFTAYYAVKLGASSSEMGWFQSSTNISNNLMQLLWGRLSDRLKRRIPFIVFGGLIVSALWIPMIFVTSPTQLIMLLAFQALLGSMAIPTWTALIGDLVHPSKFGRINASINLWASIGGLVATLIAGILMMRFTESLQAMFIIPLVLAATFGTTASLIMLSVKEKKTSEKLQLKGRIKQEIRNMTVYAKNTPNFLRYCYVDAVFQFFMSIAWPVFTITQVKVLSASPLELAILSIVQTAVTIGFQGWAGRLADSAGRKPLLIFFRFALVTVPITYALAPNIITIMVVGTFWGFAQALGNASATAYLLDVAPESYRGSFIAIYNLIIGVVTFFGSLIGGYMSDYMIGLFGLIVGLQVVYAVSIAGRSIGAALHLTLTETLKH
jgi:MFS family permease